MTNLVKIRQNFEVSNVVQKLYTHYLRRLEQTVQYTSSLPPVPEATVPSISTASLKQRGRLSAVCGLGVGSPGGVGRQPSSSELSPQSSSESQRHVFSTHLLLAHRYSFGWQPPRSADGRCASAGQHGHPEGAVHGYSEATRLQGGHTVTGKSHDYREVTRLQGGHTVTGRSHGYREVTRLQGGHTATGRSHGYREVTWLQGSHTATPWRPYCHRTVARPQRSRFAGWRPGSRRADLTVSHWSGCILVCIWSVFVFVIRPPPPSKLRGDALGPKVHTQLMPISQQKLEIHLIWSNIFGRAQIHQAQINYTRLTLPTAPQIKGLRLGKVHVIFERVHSIGTLPSLGKWKIQNSQKVD